MQLLEYVLLCLAAILISALVSQFLSRVSTPLIQISLGIVIALTPIIIDVTINTEIFMVLFVAPLLFDEGRNAHKKKLWEYRRPILSLALGLVVLTVVAGGLFVHWLIPSIPLPAAFALMAALAPTDAVAVASLAQQINMSEGQRINLEGEALLNDASGIVSFQVAVAALLYGTFNLWEAAGSFALAFFGGLALGALVMLGKFYLMKWLQRVAFEDTTFHVLLEIFTPFIVYLLAEALGVSGILAVVSAGLLHNYGARKINPIAARRDIVSSSTWTMLVFILNGLVFILLGSQLPETILRTWESMQSVDFSLAIWAIALTAFIMGVRFLWVYLVNRPPLKKGQARQARIRQKIQNAAIITLCGPKGAVTLAVILSLPYTFVDGSAFPQRRLLLFLASAVIIITLLAANFIAPIIVPKRVGDQSDDTEALIEILRNVVVRLTGLAQDHNRAAVQEVVYSYNQRIERAKRNASIEDEVDMTLRHHIAVWERRNTLRRMEEGTTSSAIGYAFLLRISRSLSGKMRQDETAYLWKYMKLRWSHRVERRDENVKVRLGKRFKERHNAMRELRISNFEYVVDRLEDMLDSYRILPFDEHMRVEDISAALIRYRRRLEVLYAMGSGSQFLNVTDRLTETEFRDEVESLALRIEREEISRFHKEGRINVATAKRMRANITMMELDVDAVLA